MSSPAAQPPPRRRMRGIARGVRGVVRGLVRLDNAFWKNNLRPSGRLSRRWIRHIGDGARIGTGAHCYSYSPCVAQMPQVDGQSGNAPLVVAKPLLDSQRTRELLEYFPKSFAIWIYRHYKSVARVPGRYAGPVIGERVGDCYDGCGEG